MANVTYQPAGACAPPRDGTDPGVNETYLAAGAVQPDIDSAAVAADDAIFFGMNF